MQNTSNAPKYTMTPKELAERMGISMPSAYNMTEIKGFPLLRLGKKKLIPIEAFERWLGQQTGDVG